MRENGAVRLFAGQVRRRRLPSIYLAIFSRVDIRGAARQHKGIQVRYQLLLLNPVFQRDQYRFTPGFSHGLFVIGDLGAVVLRLLFRRSPGDPHTGTVESFGAHGTPNRSIRREVRQPAPFCARQAIRSGRRRDARASRRVQTVLRTLKKSRQAGKPARQLIERRRPQSYMAQFAARPWFFAI